MVVSKKLYHYVATHNVYRKLLNKITKTTSYIANN